MANIGTFIGLLMGYYFLLAIMVICLSFGGLLGGEETVTSGLVGITNYSGQAGAYNITTVIPETSSTWDIAGAIWNWITFETVGLDLGLGGFGNFLVTFIFVLFPGLLLTVMIVLAIRGGSA
jgi:hypothetical protein